MKKRHEMIPCPAMGRKMHVWCYGHFGMPLLAFPSAAGFAHEWDAQGMIDALSDFIYQGKLKIYCAESNVSRTWTHKEGDLDERLRQHKAYEAFIVNTLVPWIYKDCHTENIPIAAAGCSLGGFYAANFALKFPQIFRYSLSMSGRYNMTHFTGGVSNGEVYLNNPIAFASNLQGKALERIKAHTQISLVCGQGAFEEGCIEETLLLGKILQAKGIPCTLDIWGHDSRHDWNWWKRQARLHLNKTFG